MECHPSVYVDVITYPCPNTDVGLANLYLKKGPMCSASTEIRAGRSNITRYSMWVYLLIHALASTGVKMDLENLSLIEIS